MTQNIPIGSITSPHAVRLRRPPPRLSRLRPHVVAVLAGMAAAAAGAGLMVSPPHVAVQASARAYDIGGSRLTLVAPGQYRGQGGAALVISHAGGVTRAGSSATMNGSHVTGECALRDGALSETCRFTTAGRTLVATDAWTGSGWRRRYGDGGTAEIAVSGGRPVPVPFPVGR